MNRGHVLYTGLDPAHYKTKDKLTHIPFIRITPRLPNREDIRSAFAIFLQYTHIIITSKSTIKILIDYLNLFGYCIEDWKTKITLAVGIVTARYLNDAGIHSLIVAKEETSEGVIQEIESLDPDNAFFFRPHSARARPVLNDFFDRKGIRCNRCALYDTESIAPEIIPDLNHFDEIVFTSPSTVKAFLQIYKNVPSYIKVTCIGPITLDFFKESDKSYIGLNL